MKSRKLKSFSVSDVKAFRTKRKFSFHASLAQVFKLLSAFDVLFDHSLCDDLQLS